MYNRYHNSFHEYMKSQSDNNRGDVLIGCTSFMVIGYFSVPIGLVGLAVGTGWHYLKYRRGEK